MHLRTYQELLNEQLQEQYPRDEIQHFFYLLVEHYLNENRFILAKNPEYEIPLDCLKPLEQALIDLKAHRPIQYIMGVWEDRKSVV